MYKLLRWLSTVLLDIFRELQKENRIYVVGNTSAARWFISGN